MGQQNLQGIFLEVIEGNGFIMSVSLSAIAGACSLQGGFLRRHHDKRITQLTVEGELAAAVWLLIYGGQTCLIHRGDYA